MVKGSKLQEDSSLLNALVESDQLGPAFKAVFESNKEQEMTMIKRLDDIVQGKQDELQDICNSHFQEFVNCVDSLLELRVEANELQESLKSFDAQLQSTGDDLLQKSKQHVRLLKVSENMRQAKQHVQQCLNLFYKIRQIKQSLDSQMHILALRQLEELQNGNGLESLAVGSGAFEWSKYYYHKVIPAFQERICNEATERFNNWLFSVRALSPKVGEFALAQSAYSQQSVMMNSIELEPTMSSSSAFYDRMKYYTKIIDNGNLGEVGLFDYVDLDFTPVYQCLHIHDVLNQRTEFQKYYQENRKLQCNLALQLDSDFSKSTNDPAERFAKYFFHVAGFYIIEDTVFKNTTNFLSPETIDDLWRMGTSKVSGIVNELLFLHDPEDLTYLMDAVALFTETMRLYSYDISPWINLLSNISEHCAQKSLEQAHQKFVEIFGNEKYEPLRMNRKHKRYHELITSNNLESDPFGNIGKGDEMVFPFSAAVPMTCNQIKEFLSMAHDFCRFAKKPDEQLSNTLEQLLMHMRNCIVLSMEESYSHANLAQLVQIHQNLEQFICFVENDLEEVLINLRYSAWIIKRTLKPMVSGLRNAQLNAEDMLIKLCKDKISLFLSLTLDIDWVPSAPRAEAHDHVQDFVIYLGAIYQMLLPLCADLQHDLLARIHGYIASNFLGMLGDIKEFNSNSVRDIQTDVLFILEFAKTSGHSKSAIEGLKSISETVKLLLEPNPDCYLDKKSRRQFRHISPESLESILRQYKPNMGCKQKSVSDDSVRKLLQGLRSMY